jgi:hypothetical protein
MKLENLNLGTALSKNEQKKIKGGQGPCPVGSGTTDCICDLGEHPCVPGTGQTPIAACQAFCISISQGGARSASNCILGACQP